MAILKPEESLVASIVKTWLLLFFSRQVVSDYLRPRGLQYARNPYPSHPREFAQVHMHRVRVLSKHLNPLSPSSPFALNLSQHQVLF